MKKKHKTLYLSKETIATLTGGSGAIAATQGLDCESTLTPCTSLCTTCTESTASAATCIQ